MTWRTTILLLGAVLIAGILIVISERNLVSTVDHNRTARLVLPLEPDQIQSIRIELATGAYSLARTGARWNITHPVQAPANAAAVLRLLETAANLKWSARLDDERETTGLGATDTGLDAPVARLELVTANGRTNSLTLGKNAGSSNLCYALASTRKEIWVVEKTLLDQLPGSLQDLRDRKLLGLPLSAITRIECETPERKLQLSRARDRWLIERPMNARASGTAVHTWLEQFRAFMVVSFVADSLAAAPLYGLDSPVAHITFSSGGAAPHTIKIGNTAGADGRERYAAIAGQEQVFTVGAGILAWAATDADEFRDRTLLPIPAEAVTSLRINDAQNTLILAKTTGGVWQAETPQPFIAYGPAVAKLIEAFGHARAIRFADPAEQPPLDYGLAEPVRSITFTGSSGSGPEESITIHAGNRIDGERMLAGIGMTREVAEVSGSLGVYFDARTIRFRDPLTFELEPSNLLRITQQLPDRTITLVNSNGLFRAQDPLLVPDTDAISRIIAACAQLRAKELIADDARDLTLYGLDADCRKIIFGLSSEGINRVLLIGRPTPDGDFYAMRQGYDLLFTLAPEMVALLMTPVANPLDGVKPSNLLMIAP